MPENVLNATWPEALKSVYEIKTSDPVEGGPDGIDNKPHKDLERRTDYLLQEIARVAGLVPGTSEYEELIEYLKTLDVSIVTSRVDYIRTLLRALGLYTDSKFWFEFFERPEAEADLFDTAVEEAHAGSDCIDLVDTAGVKAGKEYYLYDENHAETVVVLEVLDVERFRTVEPIHHTYSSSARLVRTKWSFKPTEGVALPGTWYYSKEMQLGYSADKTLVVRRQDNAGTLRVFSRGSGQTWKEIPWEWKRDVGEIRGVPFVDVEYPIRGNEGLEIKILCEGEEIVIHWMAAVAGKTNLRGTHNGPHQPVNVSPEEGATDVQETPTLQVDVYRHPAGSSQKSFEIQISESPDFADLVLYDFGLPAGTSYSVSAGVLKANKTYFYRARFSDVEDSFSLWSEATSFSTSLAFIYVQTPKIITPANGAVDVSDTPTLECTAFGITGAADIHTATVWQVREASEGWNNPVYNIRSETDKTSVTLPVGLLKDGKTSYFARCMQESGANGNSEWSAESRFVTKQRFANIYGAASIAYRYVRHIDVEGNFISPTKENFDAHKVWGGMADVVASGQDMVKIPKQYIKRGLGPEGSDAEGKECWWISDSPYPGFILDPTFKIGNTELEYVLIGKYEAHKDEQNPTMLGSLPGKTSHVNISFGTAKSMAAARGDGWHVWDIQELSTIQRMFLIENASFDAQGKISQGPSAKPTTGSTDVVYRGIHGLWRHIDQWVDGMYFHTTRTYLMSEDGLRTMRELGVNPSTFGFSSSGTRYVQSFQTDLGFENIFIVKTGTSTADSAIAPDSQIQYGTFVNSYPLVGGSWDRGDTAGLWFFCAYGTNDSPNYAKCGSRIAKR